MQSPISPTHIPANERRLKCSVVSTIFLSMEGSRRQNSAPFTTWEIHAGHFAMSPTLTGRRKTIMPPLARTLTVVGRIEGTISGDANQFFSYPEGAIPFCPQ